MRYEEGSERDSLLNHVALSIFWSRPVCLTHWLRRRRGRHFWNFPDEESIFHEAHSVLNVGPSFTSVPLKSLSEDIKWKSTWERSIFYAFSNFFHILLCVSTNVPGNKRTHPFAFFLYNIERYNCIALLKCMSQMGSGSEVGTSNQEICVACGTLLSLAQSCCRGLQQRRPTTSCFGPLVIKRARAEGRKEGREEGRPETPCNQH